MKSYLKFVKNFLKDKWFETVGPSVIFLVTALVVRLASGLPIDLGFVFFLFLVGFFAMWFLPLGLVATIKFFKKTKEQS